MSIIKVDYGSIGGGGTKGANGTVTSASTNTEYTIDTGLSTIETFAVYGQGNTSGNAGSMTIYDSRRNNSTLLQGGGSTNILNKGSSLPLANGAHLFGITSITNGTVVVKTPTSDTTLNGVVMWSATGT